MNANLNSDLLYDFEGSVIGSPAASEFKEPPRRAFTKLSRIDDYFHHQTPIRGKMLKVGNANNFIAARALLEAPNKCDDTKIEEEVQKSQKNFEIKISFDNVKQAGAQPNAMYESIAKHEFPLRERPLEESLASIFNCDVSTKFKAISQRYSAMEPPAEPDMEPIVRHKENKQHSRQCDGFFQSELESEADHREEHSPEFNEHSEHETTFSTQPPFTPLALTQLPLAQTPMCFMNNFTQKADAFLPIDFSQHTTSTDTSDWDEFFSLQQEVRSEAKPRSRLGYCRNKAPIFVAEPDEPVKPKMADVEFSNIHLKKQERLGDPDHPAKELDFWAEDGGSERIRSINELLENRPLESCSEFNMQMKRSSSKSAHATVKRNRRPVEGSGVVDFDYDVSREPPERRFSLYKILNLPQYHHQKQ